jgi:uncharacterized protein (TIGR03435 family)
MQYAVCTAIAFISINVQAQTFPAGSRFEVASVKPAANDQTRGGIPPRLREMMRSNWPPGMMPMDDPGRVRAENWALLDLIAAAYRVRATQVSGPAWLSDQSFDIEAKVPDGAPKEEVNAMLQSLLEERFGLKVHRDTRTGQGFALVVGKNGPKLKPAEPPPDSQKRMADMQKRMQENQESRTPRVGISRANFPSITTEQLAFQLVRFVEAPVADETGLTGKYHVTIETWKNVDVPGGTVFDAVEKLGLKLEARKVPIETVVVDQVSKTPTAN